MKRKSLESETRRKQRIQYDLRTRVAEDKTKYKRSREKKKIQDKSWDYL